MAPPGVNGARAKKVIDQNDGGKPLQVLKLADGRSQVNSDGDDSTSDEEAGSVHSVDADEVDKVLPSEPAYSANDDPELLPLQPEDFPGVDVTAPVQVHHFNQQIPHAKMNLALGLCFGHAAETGNRRTMEDRTTVIADLFASDRQQRSPHGSSTAPPPPSPVPTMDAGGADSDSESPVIAQSVPAHEAQCSEPLSMGDSNSATEEMPLSVLFFGVYDRHGHGGCDVAEALEKDLHRLIVKNGLRGDPVQALEKACLEMDEACLARDLKRMLPPPPSTSEDAEDQPRRQSLTKQVKFSGATAAVALVLRRRDDARVGVYAANVGDCRAVLRDRLDGVLEVSRSFGDIGFKVYPPPDGTSLWGPKQSLIAKPDIQEVEVQPDDGFLILASDGIWGFVKSQQAVNLVQRRLLNHGSAQQASQELVKKALQLRSNDNCNCVVVCLNQSSLESKIYNANNRPDVNQSAEMYKFKEKLDTVANPFLQKMPGGTGVGIGVPKPTP
ncbi:phosphatase 2C-like domain-containing protein [Tribonema minus]|uniref:Phosphatase 2C-like domain-containing protein n=1 Tax=Tribonema minus TaxID=303371 RepID=A0A835YL13_9STRA|nr:phosphatase 2C-like domain-containing protein [Tribonema minus]